jgi:uncharacterized cupin superfamily protein
MADVRTGEGWAAATLDDLGQGPGFRKVRSALGVEAFGVNAVELPPGYEARPHFHERQEELYLVLEGEIAFGFGEDEESVTLGAGGLVRVDPMTVRRLRNASPDRRAVYFCVGGAGGYVGRDGRRPDGDDL